MSYYIFRIKKKKSPHFWEEKLGYVNYVQRNNL